MSFTWKNLENAQNSYERLKNIISKIKDDRKVNKEYLAKFEKAINDDLNTPQALAVLWQVIKDKKVKGKIRTIKEMDKIFSLDLLKKKITKIPVEVKKLANEREKYRRQKNWQKSDEIRQKIKELGWLVEDTEKGPIIKQF